MVKPQHREKSSVESSVRILVEMGNAKLLCSNKEKDERLI